MSNEAINDLKEIRKLMEHSSKFISVSGLSAIFAGVTALVGAGVAYFKLGLSPGTDLGYAYTTDLKVPFMVTDAVLILIVAGIFGLLFTWRKARKQGQSLWTTSSRQLLLDFCFPLAVGGFFCIFLYVNGFIGLMAPSMLIFYGLSLVNASHKTLSDVRYLGYCQVILGCLNLLLIGFGFLFWCLGFGVLHIVYGSIIYFKYER